MHRGNIEKTKLNSLSNHYNISHHLCGHYDFYAWAGLEVSEAYESGSFCRNLRLARKKESNEEGYRSSRTLIGTICKLFLLMLTMSTSVIFNISKIQTIAHSLSEEVVEILGSIQKAFGYKMLFAICDATGNYYTYKGLSRTIDRYNDPDDSWYLEFDIERIEEEYLEDFDANRIDAGDYPGNSINELERKADEAMYQNKSEYYARTGKDRRRR